MAVSTSRAKHTTGPRPSGGELTIDPTENVKALTEAANTRQDDLRAAAKELSDVKIAHQEQIGALREDYQEKLRKAESERLDSIRQVDREDVNKTATQAQSAIAALAQVTTTTAETLRTQVATTAAAQATALANSMGEVNKRLSALELSSSEGRGKQAVESPQFAELISEQKRMNAIVLGNTGQSAGAKNLWAIIAGVVVLALAFGSFVIGAAGVVIAVLKSG